MKNGSPTTNGGPKGTVKSYEYFQAFSGLVTKVEGHILRFVTYLCAWPIMSLQAWFPEESSLECGRPAIRTGV